MKPIELLKNELASLERAKDKSIMSYRKCEITPKVHNRHINNLMPRIREYRETIKALELMGNITNS